MTVKALYEYILKKLPTALSAEWDNDGLSCCPDPEKEVSRVLVCLDVTADAVERAVTGGFDLILSHHPLIFRPVSALTPTAPTPAKLLKLAANGVAAIGLHTRLDAAKGGVNDTLASLFALEDVQSFAPLGEPPCGRIGTLPQPITAEAFASKAKQLLHAPFVLLAGKGTVQKIAVLGGEGGDFVEAAMAAGADLFLSGRIGYHRMLDAPENGICLIEAGHYATEYPILSYLENMVHDAAPTATVEIYPTTVLQTI